MFLFILKGLIIIFIVVSLTWGGACVYRNFISSPAIGIPKPEEAAFIFLIKNTGGVVLSNSYRIKGDGIKGSRIFILDGYWEVSDEKFRFHDGTLTLDEDIFGEIKVGER